MIIIYITHTYMYSHSLTPVALYALELAATEVLRSTLENLVAETDRQG